MNFIGHWNATQDSYLSDATLKDSGNLVVLAFGAALAGALGDADPLAPGTEAVRPVLKGHKPPSFEEALSIFKEVVKSVRLRQSVIATSEVTPKSKP